MGAVGAIGEIRRNKDLGPQTKPLGFSRFAEPLAPKPQNFPARVGKQPSNRLTLDITGIRPLLLEFIRTSTQVAVRQTGEGPNTVGSSTLHDHSPAPSEEYTSSWEAKLAVRS